MKHPVPQHILNHLASVEAACHWADTGEFVDASDPRVAARVAAEVDKLPEPARESAYRVLVHDDTGRLCMWDQSLRASDVADAVERAALCIADFNFEHDDDRVQLTCPATVVGQWLASVSDDERIVFVPNSRVLAMNGRIGITIPVYVEEMV